MLETINLTKRYEDGELALDGLTFKVEPGEIFCMFGANGAGKTTTINLFLNFIPATSGTALIEGIDVAKDPLFNDTATTEIYTLALHDALPISINSRFSSSTWLSTKKPDI